MSKSFRGETLVGKQFGRWTVLEFIPNNKPAAYWLCECSCISKTQKTVEGAHLKRGQSKSCGCLRNEMTSKRHFRNLEAQTFGKLIVLKKSDKIDNYGAVYWQCQCTCNDKTILNVQTHDLTSGKTKSCSCLRKEQTRELGKNNIRDLINQTFGRLTVIEKTDERIRGSIVWKCKCSCEEGNIIYVPSTSLVGEITQSCGCLRSVGELNISTILQKNNIPFEDGYTFDNLFSPKGWLLPFDFKVSNGSNQYIIEFDGNQHKEFVEFFHKTQENFEYRKLCDRLKNQYCIDNNIPLIRIPYKERDNITLEMLQLETTPYLYNT